MKSLNTFTVYQEILTCQKNNSIIKGIISAKIFTDKTVI